MTIIENLEKITTYVCSQFLLLYVHIQIYILNTNSKHIYIYIYVTIYTHTHTYKIGRYTYIYILLFSLKFYLKHFSIIRKLLLSHMKFQLTGRSSTFLLIIVKPHCNVNLILAEV